MRVLAVQLKRIGDLLLTLPALRALKIADARISLALMDGTAALLPAMAHFVDESLVWRRAGWNAGAWARALRGGFDQTVDYTGNDRSALLTFASRAPVRVTARDSVRGRTLRQMCYNKLVDTSVRERHTVDFYLDLLGLHAPSGPSLILPPDVVTGAREALAAGGLTPGQYIVVHPGSAREEKYWEAERWAAVIDHCQGVLGIRCVLTGGSGDPFEDAHLAQLRKLVARPPVDLAGKLDLLTLAAVIADAAVFVGVDSGPMHLAAVWEKPQLALFGQTNPFHWRPRHARSIVLLAGSDHPLRTDADFDPRASKGFLNAISTLAVTGCIEELVALASGVPAV